MNSDQRLKLNELIKEGNVQDNTSNIQRIKHSKKILNDVNKVKLIMTQSESLEYDLVKRSYTWVYLPDSINFFSFWEKEKIGRKSTINKKSILDFLKRLIISKFIIAY